MQNTHTLSERIPASKHDVDICKIELIYVYTLCSQVTGGKMQHSFLKALSFKHKPGVLRIEFRFTT